MIPPFQSCKFKVSTSIVSMVARFRNLHSDDGMSAPLHEDSLFSQWWLICVYSTSLDIMVCQPCDNRLSIKIVSIVASSTYLYGDDCTSPPLPESSSCSPRSLLPTIAPLQSACPHACNIFFLSSALSSHLVPTSRHNFTRRQTAQSG